MPDQPDIKTRIAEILRAHSTTVVQYRDTDAAGCCVRCKCGVPATHHELHVTNKLVAELGLTQEWAIGCREFDGIGNVIPRESRTDAEILNMEHRYDDRQGYSVVNRYVTEWVPDVP